MFAVRSRELAVLARAEQEHAALQRHLEARNREILELKAEVRNLRTVLAATPRQRAAVRSNSPAAPDPRVSRQLAELVASQSNTLAAIEASAEIRAANQAALAALATAANDAQQAAETAHQKTEELISTLNVPDAIAAMDAVAGLANPNVQAYWPYFEAKRDEETLQRLAEASRLRLLQETVDSGTDAAAPANPQ